MPTPRGEYDRAREPVEVRRRITMWQNVLASIERGDVYNSFTREHAETRLAFWIARLLEVSS